MACYRLWILRYELINHFARYLVTDYLQITTAHEMFEQTGERLGFLSHAGC
jgi:hypothetical protein